MKPFKLILCLLLIVVLGSCASDDENSIGLGYSDIYNLPEIPYTDPSTGETVFFDSTKMPNNDFLISPRVGFSWDIKEDQSLKLRGGTGIFTGRLPLVFFTNMPTNSGMVQGSVAAVTRYNSDGSVRSVDPRLAGLAGPIITDVNEMISRLGAPNTITP